MKLLHIGFGAVATIILGSAIIAIVFASLSAKTSILATPDLIGPANLVWKISFDSTQDEDLEDILGSVAQAPTNETEEQPPEVVIEEFPEDEEEEPPESNQFTHSGLDKWRHTNDYNNALCQRAIDAKIDNISKCIYAETECEQKTPSVSELWEDDVIYSACTTASMRNHETRIALGSLVRAQFYYLLSVKQVTEDSLFQEDELAMLVKEAFPVSVLFGENMQDSRIMEIVSANKSTNGKIEDLCQYIRSENAVFFDEKNRSVSLEVGDLVTHDRTAVHLLQDSLSQPDRSIPASSNPHNAEIVVVISEQKFHTNASLWANSQFDWAPVYGPQRLLHEASNTEQTIRALESFYKSSAEAQKVMFIVEAVQNVETVRQFMVNFLYTANLGVDHWIYFFPSETATPQDRSLMTRYLMHNAWSDVHWQENLERSNSSSNAKAGSTPRFYGLRGKSPSGSNWVMHIKKGTMKITDIPSHFDYRSHPRSECLYPVASQGACGSCWAVTAGEMISSVKCLASEAEYDYPISVQDILSCVESEIYGCKGAFMSDALLTAKNIGFVNNSCVPYFNGNCHDLAAHGTVCSAEAKAGLRLVPTASCRATCEDGTEKKRRHIVSTVYWLNAGVSGRTSPRETATIIQEYIMTRGPVIAGIAVYPDFEDPTWSENGDVYVHHHDPTQRLLGGHAILLVGWGTQKLSNGRQVDYWIAKNSWSDLWGERGYFKLARGTGGVPYVEEEVYSIDLVKSSLFY